MSNRFTQATIPEPLEDVRSLRTVALATKELVETLAGQRGSRDDQAVLWGEFPRGPLTTVIDQQWNPLPYVNGWTDFSDPNYVPAGFRKLSNGLVIMRGLVANGTATGIFVLPVGYRPGVIALTIAHYSGGFCRIDVSSNGGVSHSGGAPAWISLNNVIFYAEN